MSTAPTLDRLEECRGPITAAELLREYFRYCPPGEARPPTDPDDLAHVCRWLAADRADASARALVSLTTADVLRFVGHEFRRRRRGRRLCVSTVYRRMVALHRFFEFGLAAGFVMENPVPPERARR